MNNIPNIEPSQFVYQLLDWGELENLEFGNMDGFFLIMAGLLVRIFLVLCPLEIPQSSTALYNLA